MTLYLAITRNKNTGIVISHAAVIGESQQQAVETIKSSFDRDWTKCAIELVAYEGGVLPIAAPYKGFP